MPSRRILLTGLSTYWGGRLAQALETDPEIETIVGVDTDDPTRELQRTEFVRVGTQHALLRRIVQAARIDTVIDTRLVVDSAAKPAREAHENNVLGTMNILAACGGANSPVRKVIVKSSAHFYGAEQDDPAFFTEDMDRPHAPRTPIERDIVEAEAAVADFARRHREKTVSVLRFANGLGADLRTSHIGLLSLPVVPTILGFDPRYQFIHEDDIVGCLEHAARAEFSGVFNCAADGVLVLSEVLGLLGRPSLPVLPPWGTGLAVGALRRLGLSIPAEVVNQLRFGRGLDNRRFKATGYHYRFTTREAVEQMTEHLRVRALLDGGVEPYRYEQEVEDFVRRSPAARPEHDEGAWPPSRAEIARLRSLLDRLEREDPDPDPGTESAGGASRAPATYDELGAEEVVALLPSLRRADLEELRRHERERASRPEVLEAIEAMLGTRA